MTNVITKAAALPYQVARLPLATLERRVTGRLDETSPARVGVDRVLGSSDRLAGRLLRNEGLVQSGTARLARTQQLADAARLEAEAAEHREQAGEKAAQGRARAAAKRREAQQRAETALDDADAAEAEATRQAETTAQEASAAKKRAADERAADKKAAAQRRRRQADAAARAEKKAATAKAKAEVDDARARKQAADESRADADRLEELTEAKKDERTAD